MTEGQPTEREWLEGLRYEDKFPERCPVCGTDDPNDHFSMLDRGRAFDAGISGCPDPFHDRRKPPPNPDTETA